MTGRNAPRTLVAEAWGEEFKIRTAAPYEYAGILTLPLPDKDFPRRLVAKGTSKESVTKRTRTENNTWRPGFLRRHGRAYERHVLQVVRFYEETAPCVREYFGTHRVVIDYLFKPETGWITAQKAGLAGTFRALRAGRSDLRKLAADGWTGVQIRVHDGNRPGADFEMAALLKSMRKGTRA